MSTILSSKQLPVSQTSIVKEKISITQLAPILNAALIGGAVLLTYFNLWFGIALFGAYIVYVSREFISFVYYLLTMDFDFDQDLFRDLEEI